MNAPEPVPGKGEDLVKAPKPVRERRRSVKSNMCHGEEAVECVSQPQIREDQVNAPDKIQSSCTQWKNKAASTRTQGIYCDIYIGYPASATGLVADDTMNAQRPFTENPMNAPDTVTEYTLNAPMTVTED